MALSVFDLFKIGIGPSSSHTVGPMWAAHRFLGELDRRGLADRVARVRIELFGSLALTGLGHATDRAVILGLAGEVPDRVDPDEAVAIVDRVRAEGVLPLAGSRPIPFHEPGDLIFHRDEMLPRHPNGLRFSAFDDGGGLLLERAYYSVGGGFVVDEDEAESGAPAAGSKAVPHEFASGAELMSVCESAGLTIAGLMLANEDAMRPRAETEAGLDRIWAAMGACIERGCKRGGILPGGLEVRRRAADLYQRLLTESNNPIQAADPLAALDWVSLFALAVNEENAAGGRVVTAPTNGAAGVIPAVLTYYDRFVPGSDPAGIREFLLTAAAIGMLYKRNASLSAAEVGCQGEVGVACSMAAAGLAAVTGGTIAQVENAAEIGMEHNLGLTCDPIGGLVQVPCIERNTMGAAKAINAARLALRGDGRHSVSLDRVIETMRQTGVDMQAKYKETSLGGLAVNLTEC